MPSLLTRIATRLGFTPTPQARAAVTSAEQAATARTLHGAMQHQRNLLAALTTNDVASWQGDGLHVNASTETGLATVRARSRDASLNNPFARRFLGMVSSNILGPHGIRYQSRVRTGTGTLRTGPNDALEAAWAAWGKAGVCDVTGRYTWRDVQRLALRHVAVDGEVFLRFMPGRGAHRLQVQLLPAEVVPVTARADLAGGVKVRQGVEVDANGQVLAYHVRADDPTTSTLGVAEAIGGVRGLTRVPASEILHLMLPEQVGQLRGIPWMAAALKPMHQAQDFASSGLNKARESAKRGGWLKQSLEAEPPPNLEDGKDADGNSYQSLHDGTWEQLPAGMEPMPFESDYPNIEYGQFIKDCTRQISSALDVAYITLGNDLEAVNYSSGQLGLEGERTMWLALQLWVTDHLCDIVHRRWLAYALVAAPELQSLSFDRLDLYAAGARWQAHRWQPIDLLKTTEAQRSRIEARLTSPQREIVANGDDPDEILAELREWAEKTKDMAPAATTKPATAAPAAPAAPEDRAALRLQLIASRSAD
jgi:lambda family phage portal protein